MADKTFLPTFGYNRNVRLKPPERQYRQDLRDTPIYSIPEAARFLAIPGRTLTSWFSGPDRVFRPAGDYRTYSMLSFKDAVESYILYALKHYYNFSARDISVSMESLRRETKSQHPLIKLDLRAAEKHLFLNRPARGGRSREVVHLSRFRQLVLPEVADAFSQRILRDDNGKTVALFPWRYFEKDSESRPVSMDPDVLSGKLVVAGTRIPVSALLGLRQAKRSDEQIAKDYDLTVDVVKKALQHIEYPLSKVA